MTLARALTRCDSSLSVACAIRDAAANELVVSPLVLSPPTLLPSTAGSNVTTGLVFDVAVYLMLIRTNHPCVRQGCAKAAKAAHCPALLPLRAGRVRGQVWADGCCCARHELPSESCGHRVRVRPFADVTQESNACSVFRSPPRRRR